MQKLSILLLFLLLTGQVQAQVKFASLAECTAYALQNRPDLKNEALTEKLALYQVKQANAALLPQVKATAALDDYLSLPVQLVPAEFVGGQAGEFRSIQFGTQYNLGYGLEATLPLLQTSAWKNRKIAAAEAQAAHYQKLTAEQRAAEEIARVYYATLLSQEITFIAHQNALVNDTLALTASHKYQQGLVEALEYNRLKALQLESQQLYADNLTVYQKNLNRLKALCSLNSATSLELTEKLLTKQPGQVNLNTTPEAQNGYFALNYRLQATHQEWQKQKLSWLPEVSAYSRYTRQAQRRNFNFLAEGYPWFQIGLIGVRADWPLFIGFNRITAVKQAQLNYQIAQNNLHQYVIQTQTELADIQLSYQNAAESLKSYRQHYELYRQNYDLAIIKYQAAVYSVDQLLQVYAEKLKSQNLYINALAQYYINRSLLLLHNQYTQAANTPTHEK